MQRYKNFTQAKFIELLTVLYKALFQNPGLFIEHYFPSAHHIEVQIFGDGRGAVVDMGERECSIQRRHQKIIEESPSPFCLSHPEVQIALINDALQLGRLIQYGSAGWSLGFLQGL
ncbi:urea carboxylase [Lentinula edodes]|uniref:Urea carboxylase n=1 Tax=Lentinula edodes TaxID=5353 RepID=A0A1Q3DVL2_LENED|nr:urea carboxylase [Lentinula edodes]